MIGYVATLESLYLEVYKTFRAVDTTITLEFGQSS